MSKTSTDVATTTPAGLPALPPTRALAIDANDVQLPRLKVGQPGSPAVVDGNATRGSIFSTVSSDDEYPETLFTLGDEDGLLVHVLDMTKGLSISENNELTTWAFGDPDAHPDARTTYNYVLYLPDHDTEVPYKFLMTSTATPTARAINTQLKRNEARGPSYANAFRLTTKERKGEKGSQKFTWYVPVVQNVDAVPANVEAAGKLAGMIAGPDLEQSSGDTNGPAI